jgi:peptide/nickel transport system ATP-binding protein
VTQPLLEIDGLNVRLPDWADRAFAIKDLSLTINRNEIVCLVGESGSGKSLTGTAVMGLLPPSIKVESGRAVFDGMDLLKQTPETIRRLRGSRIAMVFQEPMTALNPVRTIGDQIGEMFRSHVKLSRREIRQRCLALLEEVRIPDPQRVINAYPHQMSGGQRQRAMIAMALALEPDLLIADEPTTALDVTTQKQIISLMQEIQRRKGMSILFITHDLGVVADIAHRVAVMQGGVLVETGTVQEVLDNPSQDYTKRLLAAVPSIEPPPKRQRNEAEVLSVKAVSKTYSSRGWFGRPMRTTYAVSDVSFSLAKNSTLGIVGESGSGKSTLARCIVGLLKPELGQMQLDGQSLLGMNRRQARENARRVQMVFQDPFASLNPRRKAGELVMQGLLVHGTPRPEARRRAEEMFTMVGLDPASMDRYPHEFSGGQRQRIGLARALTLGPELLVADEPVSALDVSVQAQVLDLLVSLRERLGLTMVFITHDLRIAAQLCDEIAVMKSGKIVEHGPAADVFANPQHAYTRELMDAIPGHDWFLRKRRVSAPAT